MGMEALGFIETKGLIAAIESADAMLKAAQVSLRERTFVGGGLVSIVIAGEVGAVHAAIAAGAAAAGRLGEVLSVHMIPGPHETLEEALFCMADAPAEAAGQITCPGTDAEERMPCASRRINEPLTAPKELPAPQQLEQLAAENRLVEIRELLRQLPTEKVRRFARQYKDLGIAGREISRAKKEVLIKLILKRFQNEPNAQKGD